MLTRPATFFSSTLCLLDVEIMDPMLLATQCPCVEDFTDGRNIQSVLFTLKSNVFHNGIYILLHVARWMVQVTWRSLRCNPRQHFSPSHGGDISPLFLIDVGFGKIQIDKKADGIEPCNQPIEVIYMGSVEIIRKPAVSIFCSGHLL